MMRWAITRLFLAIVITLAVLPYAWGHVSVRPLVEGSTELQYVLLLVGGLSAVIALTWGVGTQLKSVRWARWVRLGMWAGWIVALGIFTWMNAVRTNASPAHVGLFVLSTLWVPWLGWIGYRGMPKPWKWSVLGLLLVAIAPFPTLVRVEGLTGDNKVAFAWRYGARSVLGMKPEADAATEISLGPSSPDDSPQLLGPSRSGVYPNVKLADWTDQPPREIWRQPVDLGWSSISVVGGYCFTQEQRGTDECVTCYRLADGEPVWVHVEKTRFNSSMGGDGPRATPTIFHNRVYAVGATGRLVCLDASTGKKLWGSDLLADFGLTEKDNLEHGVCCSPLVDGDRVIVCPPCPEGPCLAAYHRESGNRLWQAGTQSASYSSPTIWETEGVRQLLLFTRDGLCGFDANTGKDLWSFPWTNGYRVNCAQPIPDAGGTGAVLLSTGYGTGATRLFIKLEGPDRWVVSQDWKRNVLKTKFTSAVLFENHAYGLDDGILTCIDIANGKPKWKDGRYKHGQVILAGDRLIVQDEFGEVVMVDASPAKWKELGRIRGLRGEDGEERKSWNVPTLSGKYLIIRNDREMVCYELAMR